LKKKITFLELAIVTVIIVITVKTASFRTGVSENPEIIPPFIKMNRIGPKMVLIEGGIFRRGSERGWFREQPVRQVKVGSFYIGKYEVTNKEYSQFKPDHPNPGDNLPVIDITWDEAVAYCDWLSTQEGLEPFYSDNEKPVNPEKTSLPVIKNGYRLPTEIEWEYACRGGTDDEYYWGNRMDGHYCWYRDNSEGTLHEVGQKRPNDFGLYDMAGNAWEFCNDCYQEYKYEAESPMFEPYTYDGNQFIPIFPADSFYRTHMNKTHCHKCNHAIRGGSFVTSAFLCRSAFRSYNYPYTGFRIARSCINTGD